MTNVGLQQKTQAHLLLVDDETILNEELIAELGLAGVHVERASNCAVAMGRLTNAHFDMLLVEDTLPGIGVDSLQKAARERLPDLAVILLSRKPDVAAAVQFLKEGGMDYIPNPFKVREVVVRVESALKKKAILAEEQEQRASVEKRLHQLLPKSIQALSLALQAKDQFTYNHSENVAFLSVALAEQLCPGNTHFHQKVRLAARFHDIGKMGVPEEILRKIGKLTQIEFERIKKHPEIGEAILRPLFTDPEILSTVRHHHERWDGQGYPDGLSGEDIPLGARIVAVAVGYDAMTTTSNYRVRMANDRAMRILREGGGTQWDANVINALLTMVDSGQLARLGEQAQSASQRALMVRAA